MFCSIIIPTIGRKTLDRAVRSGLNQSLKEADFELIVVNDSGKPLPANDWQSAANITILNANQRERSVARNVGAAIAKGEYLLFLDDDDWLEIDALKHFWAFCRHSTAAWIYGVSRLVDREGQFLLNLRHQLSGNCFIQTLAGEWIPLQASIIQTDAFFKESGFNPTLAGPEDIDLLRRISLKHALAEIPEIVVNLSRGDAGSVTDYADSLIQGRKAREKILSTDSAFQRMKRSATSPYWQGRIVRAYLTSMAWNLRRRRITTALSRFANAIQGFAVSGAALLNRQFWRAIRQPYASQTFARGQQNASIGS